MPGAAMSRNDIETSWTSPKLFVNLLLSIGTLFDAFGIIRRCLGDIDTSDCPVEVGQIDCRRCIQQLTQPEIGFTIRLFGNFDISCLYNIA
jgi:hypothetical protein